MTYVVVFAALLIAFILIKNKVTEVAGGKIEEIMAWSYLHWQWILGGTVVLGLFLFTEITILIIVAVCGHYFYSKYMLKERMKVWENTEIDEIEYNVLDREINEIVEQLVPFDTNNEEHRFYRGNIPYGRVNAFLNYFDRDILSEEIYYFSAISSLDENELREYGVVITGSGIFVAKKINKKKSKQKEILFSGLESVEYEPNTGALIVKNIVPYGTGIKRTTVVGSETTLPLKDVANTLSNIQSSVIPHVLFENKVVSQEEVEETANKAEEELKRNINLKDVEKNMSNIGAMAGAGERNKVFQEMGHDMNMRQGHGYGAEYGNKTIDRLTGKKVVGTQEKVNGHHMMNGADKIVNGEKVQVKYCRDAGATYRAGFTDSSHDYSGQKIEVPRDQYDAIRNMLQKDIDAGRLEGIEPGTSADQFLKKGFFTYGQSFRISCAGGIEGITVDMANGMMTALPGASIAGLIVFATALWQNKSIAEASKMGLSATAQVIGKGAIIFTITMQASRKNLWVYTGGNTLINGKIIKGHSVSNPLYTATNSVAGKIANSSAAQSGIGQKLHLDRLTGEKLTSGVVTVAVVFGPDVCRACMGKISVKQLAKNATIGAAGIAGASIGTAVTGGNPIGGIVGGAIGGAVTKKIADSFVEDDAIQMFRIMKEEFLDVVMSSYLTKEEFDEVATHTIWSKKVSKELCNMYKASKKGEARQYANKYISDAVVEVMKNRSKVTNQMWEEGQKVLLAS